MNESMYECTNVQIYECRYVLTYECIIVQISIFESINV